MSYIISPFLCMDVNAAYYFRVFFRAFLPSTARIRESYVTFGFTNCIS